MRLSSSLLRLAGVVGISGLAVWGLGSSQGASNIDVQPGNPSAKAPVKFADRTASGATSWMWSFGDGQGSSGQNPTHAYAQPGIYAVTLQTSGPNGMTQSTKEVNVAQSGTLVLMASTGNPFNITLHARVPSTGAEGDGEAIPQNDLFGYFTLPTLVPNTTGVPEVFVKMLDARPIAGQDFWFFWGGLTDLDYTVTVTDTVRGTVKTYTNPAASVPGQGTSPCLGADTSGFAVAGATPTPTTSAGPTPTPTPGTGGVRIVNVGQGGATAFVDAQSGTHTTNIKVGDTVQWNWMAGPHTSTSGTCRDSGGAYGGYDCTTDGVWSSGSHSSGYQYTRTFTQAGTYKYYCEVHGFAMTATVVVSAQ